MAEAKTKETLTLSTCSIIIDEDPAISAAESSGEEKNDGESCRQTKRRKNCPTALDSTNSACFSFTFDTTNLQANTLQYTPKFGSFKLIEPAAESQHISATDKVGEKSEDAESQLKEVTSSVTELIKVVE